MDFQIVIPVLISFVISVALGPIIIPFLRKLKMGQTERVDGVQSHLKKAGTPTMGGIIFLLSTVVTSLFYVKDYPKIIPILFLTLGFGIIGFLDDYLKVVLRRSDGLLPWQKFLLQVVVTAGLYGCVFGDVDSVLERTLSEHWLAGSTFAFYGGDRDGQRCEFYRWPGWSGVQCDHYGGCIFHSGFCGNEQWH